ncbi:MAG TPA: helix-turn-helix domain-containing protein [Humisphaera sp.]|nr:helix-turn-helix domain-containing protein [Humisphaera sp.]
MPVANRTKKKAGPAPRKNSTAAGRSLLTALKQAHYALATGDRAGLTVRQVEIPDPPAFDAAAVRALRDELRVSVAVFAKLLGVTPGQVEHWEQSRRTPAPLACRLLERIRNDPAGYLASLVR